LLLDSARELFARKGFAGTSTREIADHAGTSEALLFRHFGSKAVLFDRAVLDPFSEFISNYIAQWEEYEAQPHPPEVPARQYIEGLFDLLSEHRELVMALLAVQAYEVGVADDVTGPGSPLSQFLDRLEKVVEAEVGMRGWTGVDIPVTIRVTFGLVLSMAVLDDWMFPGRRPSRERIINEMVAYMIHGLAHRPRRK
jgi:AcrR family transcriptional regulator